MWAERLDAKQKKSRHRALLFRRLKNHIYPSNVKLCHIWRSLFKSIRFAKRPLIRVPGCENSQNGKDIYRPMA
jgi:hypothetical protein